VTYDNGGSRDYARDGETALVAPRRDVPALAQALGRLLADHGLRARIAAAGLAFVQTTFDWDRAVSRLETVLAGLRPPARARPP
jgi:phosphatidylinositol alpha-1,6-mannosyltransferase